MDGLAVNMHGVTQPRSLSLHYLTPKGTIREHA